MQAIDKLFKIIYKKLFPKNGPNDESLFNSLLLGSFFATIAVLIIITILGYSKKVIIDAIAGALVLFLGYWISNRFNKQHAGSIILAVVINFIICPVAFFLLGGINGGIVSIFIQGIVLTILLVNGKALYILISSELVYYGLVFYWACHGILPVTKFVHVTEEYRSTYILMFTAAFIIGGVVKLLFMEYKKESARVKELLNQVQELSIKDPLTTVYNRRYMMEFLDVSIEKAKQESIPLTIIMFDIDRFKDINDTYGHVAGDDILKGISRIFLQYCRKEDIVARYGGEEFLIILPSADMDAAAKRAEQMRISVNRDLNIEGVNQPVTISGGIAQYHCNFGTEEFIREADEKLYTAKANGRNQVVR